MLYEVDEPLTPYFCILLNSSRKACSHYCSVTHSLIVTHSLSLTYCGVQLSHRGDQLSVTTLLDYQLSERCRAAGNARLNGLLGT